MRFLWLLLALATALRATDADPLAHLRPGHPRLLFTDEQLAAAKADAARDPFRAKLHARIVAAAESLLDARTLEHKLIGPRLLDQSRAAIQRVLTCSMAYRLTSDERFLNRAKQDLLTATAFPDWNPSHFLDVAELSFAFAIGYDWLYPQLTPDERATIKRALLEKSLVFAAPAYAPGGPTDKRLWFVTAHHNWNQVCNGGLLAAALALADEEPDLARTVINGARQSLPLAMSVYAPDGGYPEGPGYWEYGTTYNVIALACLESALGTDFNLGYDKGFVRTAIYRRSVITPTGLAFNYADGGAKVAPSPAVFYLTSYVNRTKPVDGAQDLLYSLRDSGAIASVSTWSLNDLGRELASPLAPGKFDRFFALNAAWYHGRTREIYEVRDPQIFSQEHFRGGADFTVSRLDLDDPNTLFLGFKAGDNTTNHSHLDLGSFVLEADGVRWVQDLGPDDYNLPGYFDTKPGGKRWDYFRLNNRGHSTLTVGDALQNPKAVAPITTFNCPITAFCGSVADLTAAYPGFATSIKRGVTIMDRACVYVQDEVTGLKPGTPLAARIVTGANVKLDDERHATLTQSGHTLHAEILTPTTAHFTAKPATPPTTAENQNKGITLLTAELTPDTSDTRLIVVLTPEGDHWRKNQHPGVIVPLSEWKGADPK